MAFGLAPGGGGGGGVGAEDGGVVDFEDGGPPDAGGGGRFTTAAVVLAPTGRDEAATPFSFVPGRLLLTLAPTSLFMSHAESGRSFR